jgi:hypothetical protein
MPKIVVAIAIKLKYDVVAIAITHASTIRRLT